MAEARFLPMREDGSKLQAQPADHCVEQEDVMQAMSAETFIGNMRGPVIRPMDADYDAVRSLYNGMIDKNPVMIARCTDVADVVTAVNFARESDLRVAIRGGGHNRPGLGRVDDGLMVALSMMKGVRVNPNAHTVRVGPGCTQGDVDHATHIYGLAVPAGIVSISPASPLAVALDTSPASMASPSTICSRQMSCSPTVESSPPTSLRMPTSTGACAAAAAISALSRASCSRRTR